MDYAPSLPVTDWMRRQLRYRLYLRSKELAWVWFVGAVYIMHNHLPHASAADLPAARKKSRLREGFFAVLNGEEDKRPKPEIQNRPSRNTGKKKMNPVRTGTSQGPETDS